MRVWRDGRLLSEDESGPWLDRGRLLGHGVFSTLLVRDGRAQQPAAHLRRLRASALALGLGEPALDELESCTTALWTAEEARPARAALRVTISAGEGRGLDGGGELCTTVSLTPLRDRADGTCAPSVRAAVVTAHRIDPAAATAGHKTLSWLPWILARRAAVATGADVALITTVDGDIACADAANVFVRRGDELLTPPLDRGVLPGITRARVLALASRADAPPIREARIEPEDLVSAHEVLLTSSLGPVIPVGAIEGCAMDAPGATAAWLAACLDMPEPRPGS